MNSPCSTYTHTQHTQTYFTKHGVIPFAQTTFIYQYTTCNNTTPTTLLCSAYIFNTKPPIWSDPKVRLFYAPIPCTSLYPIALVLVIFYEADETYSTNYYIVNYAFAFLYIHTQHTYTYL